MLRWEMMRRAGLKRALVVLGMALWGAPAVARSSSAGASTPQGEGSASAPPATLDWSEVAVPYYHPQAVLHGVYRFWALPRAQQARDAARTLHTHLQGLCASPSDADALRQEARTAWQQTTLAWAQLSAVTVGPVVERRTVRQIDFTPTRPRLIQRGIALHPRNAHDMQRVGTPGKGLPALEWLLWETPLTDADACAFAVQVAAAVQDELQALVDGFTELGGQDWGDTGGEDAVIDEAAIVRGTGEWVNQWVAGLERLRWAQMEKPIRMAESGAPLVWSRPLGGITAASWHAQWQVLRTQAVLGQGEPPEPGAGLVPFEIWLRGQGANPLADRLVAAIRAADRTLAAVPTSDDALATATPAILAATDAMAQLRRLMEGDVAAALNVTMGFSDADGD